MKKYQGKYRIPSARHPDWDYSSNGSYYVTICTAMRQYFFGEIKDGDMNLSEIGMLVDNYWLKIPQHFPFVKLDVHVIMPNHIHGIIIIDRDVKTTTLIHQQPQPLSNTSLKKWKPGSLGVIINQYKRICTINARKINPMFDWQARFHDTIIHDEASLEKIRDYIINNTGNWKDDDFYG